jgi:hypothetical protein
MYLIRAACPLSPLALSSKSLNTRAPQDGSETQENENKRNETARDWRIPPFSKNGGMRVKTPENLDGGIPTEKAEPGQKRISQLER